MFYELCGFVLGEKTRDRGQNCIVVFLSHLGHRLTVSKTERKKYRRDKSYSTLHLAKLVFHF